MKHKNVDVVLATYNGGKFLKDFLNSLCKQTHKEFRLIVRDDGSIDETLEILNDFQEKLDIELIQDKKGNLGFYGNFSEILTYAGAEYIFFADQDDVWHPEKLHRYITVFDRENCFAIFSSFKVLDNKNNVSPDSVTQGFKHSSDYKRYFWGNNATGCTMAIRKDLVKYVKLEDRAYYHDWKIALTASYLGKLYYLNESYTYYRVHQGQASGFDMRSRWFSSAQTIVNFKRGALEQVVNLNSILSDPNYQVNRREIRRSLKLHQMVGSDSFEFRLIFQSLKIIFSRDSVDIKSLILRNIVNISKVFIRG